MVHLVGEMNGQIVRHGIIIGAGQADITLGKKQHIGYCAGNEQVRPDIKLLPFQEQRLVNVPVRAMQVMSPTGSRKARHVQSSPQNPQPVHFTPRNKDVCPCFNIS